MEFIKPFKKRKPKKLRKSVEKNKLRTKWKIKSKKYSNYPYIITITMLTTNIFFTLTDLKGRIKLWDNVGRCGYKGSNKTVSSAIFTATNKFLNRLKRYNVQRAFVKFKNLKWSRFSVKKAIMRQRKKKQLNVKFLGVWTELHVSFNGCRDKKIRRKRFRHNAKIIKSSRKKRK